MSEADAATPFGRIDGLIDVPVLQRKRVTLIGAGSMGNPVADQLVRHGVATAAPGRIRIIDGDVVEARNLIGTGYRQCHIGKSKAEATVEMLREINGEVNVSYWHRDLEDNDIDRISDMAAQSDLVGLFADSFDLMARIADRCYDLCPTVMALFGPQVDHAEVAFSLPKQTPPLAATMGRRPRQQIDKPQALGCDTAYVASFVAALCLHLLIAGHKGQELFTCFANAPLFVLGLRRTWLFAKQPDDVVRSIYCVGAPRQASTQKEIHT